MRSLKVLLLAGAVMAFVPTGAVLAAPQGYLRRVSVIVPPAYFGDANEELVSPVPLFKDSEGLDTDPMFIPWDVDPDDEDADDVLQYV